MLPEVSWLTSLREACHFEMVSAVKKETTQDPVPQFISDQIREADNWLKAAVNAMQDYDMPGLC